MTTAVTPGPPVVVVGGGHSGLVAACYLARAGRRVLVLEAADRLGGGSRTDETTCSASGTRAAGRRR